MISAAAAAASSLTLVGIALIAAFASVMGASLPILLINRQQTRRATVAKQTLDAKELEDRRRQDEVARLVKEAAVAAETARVDLKDDNTLTRQAAEKVAELVASAAEQTDNKLTVIHSLVNSQMTTALENELAEIISRVALMHEVIDLKRTTGKEPTVEALEAIIVAGVRIDALKKILAEREEQQAKLHQQERQQTKG